MYKIYINDTKIVLLPSHKISRPEIEDEQYLIARYAGKPSHLLSYIDMCEKTDKYKSITLHSTDVQKLISDFDGLFKTVEAGGGVVINEKNEILFMFRRGSWDLPKGKMDPHETRREAALREVKEETGISNVQIVKKLAVTRHTYRNRKNKRCIKLTHWYLMFTSKQDTVPQTEEDIELVEWMTLEQFYAKDRVVYDNIKEVLDLIKTARK